MLSYTALGLMTWCAWRTERCELRSLELGTSLLTSRPSLCSGLQLCSRNLEIPTEPSPHLRSSLAAHDTLSACCGAVDLIMAEAGKCNLFYHSRRRMGGERYKGLRFRKIA